jgi:hypothetical protein
MPNEFLALLKPTAEDIRKFCDRNDFDWVLFGAIYSRHAKGRDDLGISEVVYMMHWTKLNNLPMGGPWYDLIPNKAGGYTVYANQNSAWYMVVNDARIDKTIPTKWGWVGSDGTEYDQKHPPSFLKRPKDKSLSIEIDWELEGWLEVKLKEVEEPVRVGDNYLNCYNNKAIRTSDGNLNPDAPWIKNAANMLIKSIAIKFCQRYLGPCLEFDESHLDLKQLEDAERQPPRSLPSPESRVMPDHAAPSSQEVAEPTVGSPQPALDQEQRSRLIEKGSKLGMNEAQIQAALESFAAIGGTFADFEANLDKEIAKKEAKGPGKVRKGRAPKADTPAEEQPKAPKAEPKPTIMIRGTIDAIAERHKEPTDKQKAAGEQGQTYLVPSIGGQDYIIWDTKLFDAAWGSMDGRFIVDVGYQMSGEEGQYKTIVSITTVEGDKKEEPVAEAPPLELKSPEPEVVPSDLEPEDPPPLFPW